MAWFGDGLPSLSNLKGQITNFTKEVLSEGIVEEIDERTRALNEANEQCVQLQELLNSKDAEISLLRRQNCELQKTVIELNSKPKDANNDINRDEEGAAFFWDPPTAKNRDQKSQKNVHLLQEQLAQATLRIRNLESELKRNQKVNDNKDSKDENSDGYQRIEFFSAKESILDGISKVGEKTQEANENEEHENSGESALISDFRRVVSKLTSPEKFELVHSALKAIEKESEIRTGSKQEEKEKSDIDHKKSNDIDHGLNCSNAANGEIHKRDSEMQKEIEELQKENNRLVASMEELDQYHNESIEEILSLKEELEKKHQCLQKAYEQLYIDYNEAEKKASELEKQKALENQKSSCTENVYTENVCQMVQTLKPESYEKDVQTDLIEEGEISSVDIVDELTCKLKEILKNSCIDTEQGESIFEALARQYVDVKWKKDLLERKVTEVTRDWKEALEVKDALQAECDDMQTHIDSLVLQVQDLKLNLPSIPEASEERVASLESETESLHEEVKRLQTENETMREECTKLRESVQSYEVSLRKQESLEVEIRNTKEQLDIAKLQLDGASESVESTESLVEDLSHRLRETLEQNSELQKKIVSLENSKTETEQELRLSMEKTKELEENLKLLEEIKMERENVKQELISSRSIVEQLQNHVKGLEKEREENIMVRSECVSLKNDLKYTVEEKYDLEIEILSIREKLDETIAQARLAEGKIAQLTQDRENLLREKNDLREELTVFQKECEDRVELLNTELSLLQQEHDDLQLIAATKEKELNDMNKKLSEAEESYDALRREFSTVCATVVELEIQNGDSHQGLDVMQRGWSELDLAKSVAEKLTLLKSEYNQIKNKTDDLRLKENELLVLQENFVKVTEQNSQLQSLVQQLQQKSQDMESTIKSLETEKTEILKNAKETSNEHVKHEMESSLEDKVRQIEMLKSDNAMLMKEIGEMQNKLRDAIESRNESTDMAKQTIESLSHLIKKKDEEIKSLAVRLETVESKSTEDSEGFIKLQNERDELVKLVTHKHNESLQYHAEIQRLTQLLNEQSVQMKELLSNKNETASELEQKNSQLYWTQNELQVLQQRLKNIEDTKDNKEMCTVVEHSTQSAELSILHEKCNALEAALIQEQSNTRMLQNQLIESQSKESIAGKELERLRTHLVEMESNYTEEALIAEEMRKELEAKLVQAEEKIKNSSTVYTSASIRANQQVETLQQQMALIIQQRDDIQSKLSAAEDKVLSQAASLTNLQIVLEQFQRDKEKDVSLATGRIQEKLRESHKRQEELLNEMENLKEQLTDAKKRLLTTTMLHEQLGKKTEQVEQLTQEVARLMELASTSDQRIEQAKQSEESKVDKVLIKNLFLGYLSSSAADKSSVLRVFATILDFNDSEREKAGLSHSNSNNTWFARLSGGSSPPTKDQEASLSAAFVRFLESESKPKPQLPPLPIQTSPLPRPGHSRQPSSSSTQSALLLSNVNLPTFPDFVPARNTGSILKEVLKDS